MSTKNNEALDFTGLSEYDSYIKEFINNQVDVVLSDIEDTLDQLVNGGLPLELEE